MTPLNRLANSRLSSGVLQAAGQVHLAFSADVSAFGEAVKGSPFAEVELETLPATLAMNPLYGDGFHRTALDTREALPAAFVKTQLFMGHQGAISQNCAGDQAAQAPGTPHWGNELGIDPKTPQTAQVSQVFVRPAGDQPLMIEIVRRRRQACIVTLVL